MVNEMDALMDSLMVVMREMQTAFLMDSKMEARTEMSSELQ